MGWDYPIAAGLLAADIFDEALLSELFEGTVDGGLGDVEVICDVRALAVRVRVDVFEYELGVFPLFRLRVSFLLVDDFYGFFQILSFVWFFLSAF